jgi:hypothetical protein
VDVAQVLGSTLSATNPLPVRLANASGYISEDTQSVFGGAVTFTAGAAPTGGFGTWCRVSASAPSTTGVADDDAVLPWCKNTGELQVGVITVPTDPFGANADAASATGSISAKLRFIAATGIPVTSLPTVVLQAETTKVIGTVRALGNGGAAFDQATGSAVPANALYMGVNGPSGNLRGWTAVNPSGAIYAGQVDLASFLGSTVSASNPIWVATVPTATGGWSALNATAADGATACTNSAQSVKGSQGTFGGYYINNPNTSDVWLHVYNVASGSVTVGTTTPALSFRISGVSANSVGANLELANGVQFSTAISIACTSTAGGNGAPSNAVEADIFYK